MAMPYMAIPCMAMPLFFPDLTPIVVCADDCRYCSYYNRAVIGGGTRNPRPVDYELKVPADILVPGVTKCACNLTASTEKPPFLADAGRKQNCYRWEQL